ncbi:SidA/IucD/PvdA family monooxygenase [Streptomyces filamentosus]|uniref:SidA/IucD/PvdA family monooxygenase n=1 Tax=Streptomyces filamentosus TaxID=67294 RepID=UPI003321F07F
MANARADARPPHDLVVVGAGPHGLPVAAHAAAHGLGPVTFGPPAPEGFALTTEGGENVRARTVALAVGVPPFLEVPGPLRRLPRRCVTHSGHHGELGLLAGRDVTVAGAGQAAPETAAPLAEAGAAAVRILARADRLRRNTLPPALHRSAWSALRAGIPGGAVGRPRSGGRAAGRA